MTTLHSRLREHYHPLRQYMDGQKQEDPFLNNSQKGYPVFIWQNWKDLEDSSDLRDLSKTLPGGTSLTLYLPGQTLKALVIPVVKTGETSLNLGDSVTIGRSRKCDISFNLVEVSKFHGYLQHNREGDTLCDLGSSNGTWHRGHPFKDAKRILNPGDFVSFGDENNRLQYYSEEHFKMLLQDLVQEKPYARL